MIFAHDLRRRVLSVPVVVGATIAASTVAALALVRTSAMPRLGDRWPEFVFFGLLVCLCELKPVTVARAEGVQEVVASTTFSFAILMVFGAVPAIIAQAVASLTADVFAAKSPPKIVFNIAQYVLSWSVAGLLLRATVGHVRLATGTHLSWRWAVAIIGASAGYFLCNSVLVGTIIGVSGRTSVRRSIAEMITREAGSDMVLLALAPIVVVVAERSLALMPVLLLPVLAVYRSAHLSVEKEHQALHDALTNLPNRVQFASIVKRSFHGARTTSAAVLLIDLDRFKEVNDTLGHQAGDDLLCQIGPRISPAMPPGGVIARLGGDEFAVLVPDVDDEGAARIGAAILTALQTPFQIGNFNLEIEASIGIAMYPQHGRSSDALLKRADIAMYVAKGRSSGAEIYNAEQDRHSRRRLGLLSELRTALSDGQLSLHYQPKLNLATSSVTSVEALIRWNHPVLGMVLPGDFVPFAEHTGLIRPFTSFVLRTAIAQAREWRDAGIDVAVAVNLSARSLHSGAIADEVAALLAEFALPPDRLQLEITESAIMADPARAKRVLEQLDEMGLHLSIDDFGTGYSSLAYLQDLPVREVKIDRSFVMNVLDSPRDRVIVRSTIDLARHLGMQSTAEGIESQAAQEWLREAGCDLGQGYHIARPLAADQATAWLRAAQRRPADARLVATRSVA